MLRRVRASVRIAGLVVFGPGHTRHASHIEPTKVG